MVQEPAARKLRVLVVEDDADTQVTTCTLLELCGHDCQWAADGIAALEMVVGFIPDVILLDLKMPGMDGFALARALRQRPHLEHVILIAISGFGGEKIVQSCIEAGIDRHLLKPVDFPYLESILNNIQRTLY
jgi:CheY-like chemotaxis protein